MRLLHESFHQAARAVSMALEQFGPVLIDILGILQVALLGNSSAICQCLQRSLLLLGLLYEFLHNGTSIFRLVLKNLDSVLKDALGEAQVALLGGDEVIRNRLVGLLP